MRKERDIYRVCFTYLLTYFFVSNLVWKHSTDDRRPGSAAERFFELFARPTDLPGGFGLVSLVSRAHTNDQMAIYPINWWWRLDARAERSSSRSWGNCPTNQSQRPCRPPLRPNNWRGYRGQRGRLFGERRLMVSSVGSKNLSKWRLSFGISKFKEFQSLRRLSIGRPSSKRLSNWKFQCRKFQSWKVFGEKTLENFKNFHQELSNWKRPPEKLKSEY